MILSFDGLRMKVGLIFEIVHRLLKLLLLFIIIGGLLDELRFTFLVNLSNLNF